MGIVIFRIFDFMRNTLRIKAHLTLVVFLYAFQLLPAQVVDGAEESNADWLVNNLADRATENLGKDNDTSLWYIEEAKGYLDEIDDTTLYRYYMVAGRVYFYQNLYPEALQCFNQGYEIRQEASSLETMEALNSIGNVYLVTNQLDKAKEYYQKAVDGYNAKNDSTSLSETELCIVYNNLGVLEKKQGNYVNANEFFDKAYNSYHELKDTLGLIKTLQNISNNHVELQNTEMAFQSLYQALDFGGKYGNLQQLSSIHSNLGNNFLSLNNYDSAKYHLERAYKLSTSGNFPEIIAASSAGLVKIYKNEGKYNVAFEFLAINKEISDELKNEENIRRLAKIEYEYTYRQKQAEIEKRQRIREVRYMFGSGILFLMLVILLLLFRVQKHKNRRTQVEKKQLEQKLEFNKKELSSSVMNLLQVTEIINETSKRLMLLKQKVDDQNKQEILSIVREMQQKNSGQNWKEFEVRFNQINESFYKRLLKDFPDLTNNEIRLCAFLKMNMSTKEISAITRQSSNSIFVARTRLRKKLNIAHNETSFVQFLSRY